MFSFAAIVEAIKLFFSSFKVTFKGILIFLVLCALAYGEYKVYDYGKTRQASSDAVQFGKDTKQMTADAASIKSLKGQLADLQGQVNTWHSQYVTAQGNFDKLQNTTVKDLQTQLTNANKRLSAAQKLAADAKRIASYVPSTNGVVAFVPNGVIELYNGSIEDASSTGIFGVGLSGSSELNAGASSPIDLLQFSSVFVVNNATCVQRGREIKQWQTWYTSTKANWDAVQKVIQQNAPGIQQVAPPAANDPVATPIPQAGKG